MHTSHQNSPYINETIQSGYITFFTLTSGSRLM